jgi:hypothetical protein
MLRYANLFIDIKFQMQIFLFLLCFRILLMTQKIENTEEISCFEMLDVLLSFEDKSFSSNLDGLHGGLGIKIAILEEKIDLFQL